MPYICKIRSDVPDSLLQLVELKPSTSQRNSVKDPPGQTKYVRAADNDVVATRGAGPITTVKTYSGLAAYLIDRVEDTDNANAALTAAFANAIADSLIATMVGGGAVTLAVVNTAIQASTGGAATLTGGDSTATLAAVLEILSGAVYVLPAGSQVEDAGNDFDASVSGEFTHVRHIVFSGAFNISRGEGRLSVWTDAAYTYGGTAGAAVLLLNDDGSLL